ncbi:MAG: hypothetical protein QF393_05085 [Rhodospirillales bacterium]|jgi:hypothetical protein|nr:hypothetical protein [Rhodospirillales bacterium]MDP6590977.1 hypothetical protein [Alphaproteobacteria bacterium]|tara:strand:+ start:478 stop:1035 length:558 start_codon:yes stop_codon:yes gene_type:complete
MNRINYSTLFTGTSETSDYSDGAFKTSTVAPIGSIFAEDGEGTVSLGSAGDAKIKSTVVLTGNGSFQQYGTITFEDSRDRLHFSTQGQGRIEDGADKRASATLKIDRGEGRFQKKMPAGSSRPTSASTSLVTSSTTRSAPFASTDRTSTRPETETSRRRRKRRNSKCHPTETPKRMMSCGNCSPV